MKIQLNNIFANNFIKNNAQIHKSSNLLPLSKDTVSFTSRAELIGADMVNAPNNKTCIQAANNAEVAQWYLQKVLDKYIGPFTQKDKSSDAQKFPIFEYFSRTKSPGSIREKVVSKYAKICANDTQSFADDAAKGFLKYFTPKTGTQPRDIADIIRRTIEKNQEYNKIAPYQNIKYLFGEIINTLDEKKVLDMDNYPMPEQKKICAKIIDEFIENHQEQIENNCDSKGGYINPTHIDGVKHYANDIVGARIIMRESDKTYVNTVLKALERAVEDKKLKITSIQNNLPDPLRMPRNKKISDYEYASEQSLERLAKNSGAEYNKINTKTGYLGIHIDVDLSDELLKEYNGIYNGYSGEIQIIGTDVLKLKEVEDLCYKIKDKKNAINAGYEPFRNYFLEYYSDDKVKKAFDDYTYDLYLAQRSLPPSTNTSTNSFPTIDELGYNGRVPQELDFNTLAALKESCDKRIKNEETEKALETSKKTKTSNDSAKNILRNGNIATLKELLLALKLNN
jgi:hypothetical protein